MDDQKIIDLYWSRSETAITETNQKYGNRHFWARGYFVDTVGKNKKQIQEYIKNQLTLDQIADQVSIKEFVDPFTGSVNQKA